MGESAPSAIMTRARCKVAVVSKLTSHVKELKKGGKLKLAEMRDFIAAHDTGRYTTKELANNLKIC